MKKIKIFIPILFISIIIFLLLDVDFIFNLKGNEKVTFEYGNEYKDEGVECYFYDKLFG